MTVKVSYETARGCGYRKVGGLYLMGGTLSAPCERMPYELTVCSGCGHGIKPSRGWTWVDPEIAFASGKLEDEHGVLLDPASCSSPGCDTCPLGRGQRHIGRCGLLWIGEGFYPTPEDFLREGLAVGISRRVSSIPRGFVAGETWVLLAHRRGITRNCILCSGTGRLPSPGGQAPSNECDMCHRGMETAPAVFSAFVPDRVEKVVGEDVTQEEVSALEKRGITPVIVRPLKDGTLEFNQQEEQE